MPKASRIPSPARSQGDLRTPRRYKSRTYSVDSPARSNTSSRLTLLLRDKNMDSFALSPLPGRRSILTDDTNIEEPKRKSWWKKLSENSRDVIELLKDNNAAETDVIEEYINIEVISQEKKNYTNDLPESSDNESINSIIMPQRKLFTQKETQPQKLFGQLVGNRESLAKLHKTIGGQDKIINAGTRNLFQNNKQRPRPVFPSELLNISPNKTVADKTKEFPMEVPKNQVRNIFGNRPATKRKNMFTDFIMSDSEEELPDIQPKIFGFQKKTNHKQCGTSSKMREPSPPTLNFTTDEMDEWKLLPSSTMVDNQLENTITATPVKRTRLSKLSEAKESEAGTNVNITKDKTRQSNKSASSKNESKLPNHENSLKINKSIRNKSNVDAEVTKSQNKTISEVNEKYISEKSTPTTDRNQIVFQNKSQTDNITRIINTSKHIYQRNDSAAEDIPQIAENHKNQDEDENNFTLQYEYDEHDSIVVTSTNQKSNNDKSKNFSIKNKTATLRKDNDDMATDKNKILELNISREEYQHKPRTPVDQTEESNISKEHEQASTEFQTSVKKTTTSVKGDEVLKNQVENKINPEVMEYNDREQVRASDKDCNQQIYDNDVNKDAANQQVITMEVDDDEIELDVSNELEMESRIMEKEIEQDECNEAQNEDYQKRNETQIRLEHSKKVQNESEKEDSEEIQNVSEECQELQNSGIESEAPIESDENDESHEIENTEENQELENDSEENPELENDTDNEQELESETGENQKLEHDSEENPELENDTDNDQELESDTEENQKLENDSEENQELENYSEENPELENDTVDEQELESDTEENQKLENDTEENQVLQNNTEENQELQNNTAEDQELENDTEDNQEMGNDTKQSEERIQSHDNIEQSDEDQSESEENDSDSEVEDNQGLEYESEEEIQNESNGRDEESEVIERTDTPNTNVSVHSPEAILHDKTNHIHSFIAHNHNGTARKTKSLHQSLYIRPSMGTPRGSIAMSDGTNSSAGSGWDSHRITRKTIRQTFGKGFTPRKSLRALVMEKSVKRQTVHDELESTSVDHPQANSTELPRISHYHGAEDEETDVTDSVALRQATLDDYLQKVREKNMEKMLKAEEAVKNSLKEKTNDTWNPFKVPRRPASVAKAIKRKPKKGQMQSPVPLEDLPPELLEDLKYKPPRRFQPRNASWITKRLYKYLETKLEPRYDYKARVRAEKLTETLYNFTREVRKHKVAPPRAVDALKHEMARLDIVTTHHDFYEFFHDFLPKEVLIKVVPDLVNNIPLPRNGVYNDIIHGNTQE